MEGIAYIVGLLLGIQELRLWKDVSWVLEFIQFFIFKKFSMQILIEFWLNFLQIFIDLQYSPSCFCYLFKYLQQLNQ